ncbi:MAG: hypothetical protein PHW51_06925, partial [Candidatus Omnitrophica bacterium]|nr:hypothetical protein [Candidatus Omnitrophota bacterium]
GCGRPAEKPAAVQPVEKVIATVNGEPITNKDLKMALALRISENPSLKITPNTLKEQLDLVIEERLALQHKKKADSRIEILDKNLKSK